MPAGLDGNPQPVRSAPRAALLERLADEVCARRTESVLRVAIDGIDGIDGAGKTTFADELAGVIRRRAVPARPFRRAAFDEPSDAPVDAAVEVAEPGSVLLFDGLFLSRPELRAYWDYFVYLDGESRVAAERIARAAADCPGGPAAVWHLARSWAILSRYVDGQRLYLSECQPRGIADAVVDNNDLMEPTVIFRPC